MLSAAFFARGFSIAPRHGRRRGCTPEARMRWMWPGGGGDVAGGGGGWPADAVDVARRRR